MFFKRILFFLFLLAAPAIILFALVNRPEHGLTILFTHDLHSNLASYKMPSGDNGVIETGGYARLAAAINNERRGREDKTLVLDAGDFSMGTLFHTIRSTHSPELITMGLMGYDATTLGNHEFEFGTASLAEALLTAKQNSQARLPAIIASNIVINPREKELEKFIKAYEEYPVMPYLIFNRSGLKIGIFALMGKEAAIYAPEAKPIVFSDQLEAARKAVAMLRNQEKVDLVICLSHSGTWKDKSISEDEIMAKEAAGIDLIISGHTHSVLERYIRAGSTYIVSAGCYGRYLGRLVIARKSDGSFQVLNYKLIPITPALADDPGIAGLIKTFERYIEEEYLKQFGYDYNQVLAESNFSLPDPDWDKSHDRAECITSGLGDLVGDACRYAVKAKEAGDYRNISFVFEGFGQIRVPLAKGPITVNDAFRLMALGIGHDGKAGTGLVTFWLNGKEIKKILELETTLAPLRHGMHLQVTGMRFSYDPGAEPFSRVKKVEVEAEAGKLKPLEDNRLYRVCTGWKNIAMRQSLEELSGGKIVFLPKDQSGRPIKDLRTTRIFSENSESLELKEWLAVAMYLESLSVLPEKYRSAEKNISF